MSNRFSDFFAEQNPGGNQSSRGMQQSSRGIQQSSRGIQRISNPSRNYQGDLLVASEELESSPLARTVIYVLQDDTNGSFGVVLNRPADAKLRAAWTAASGINLAEDDTHLLSGGPLGGPVFALHAVEQLGEIAVNQGIFLSATAESIDQLVNSHEEPYRICLGVVGWKVGQLQKELDRHIWYRLPSSPDLVFDQSGLLWEKSLLTFGRQTLRDILSLGDLPPNPERN